MVPRVFHIRPRVFHETPRFPPDPAFSTGPRFFHQTPCFPHPGTPHPGTPAPRFPPTLINSSKITDFPNPVGSIAMTCFPLRTPTTACFCSAFKELIFNSLSFSEMVASWSVRDLLSFVVRGKLIKGFLPFCQLSVIGHILTNQVLRCWADGGFKNSKKSLQTVFSCLAFFPTRPYHPVSSSSLQGQRHLLLQWLNARSNDPQRKNWLPAD